MKIGFIGLGNMGLPMAKNLLAAGHDVVGFDAGEVALAAAKEAGISIANSVTDAAKNSDTVITMLPNGAISKTVSDEIFSALAKGAMLLDCSTIDVESAQEIHAAAEATGILCLDAPVSGGIGGAAAGTLTFMVGGSDKAFEHGKPLFEIMGDKIVHCGKGGDGQAVKICNNMQLAISMTGACEAFLLGERLGLNPEKLFDVMSTSSGSCWAINSYCPVPNVGPTSPADNEYKPGFTTAMIVKDSKLAQQAAQKVNSATPLGKHAADLYQEMMDAGLGDMDFSGMINFLRSQKSKS